MHALRDLLRQERQQARMLGDMGDDINIPCRWGLRGLGAGDGRRTRAGGLVVNGAGAALPARNADAAPP
jgi:hypothetical protein